MRGRAWQQLTAEPGFYFQFSGPRRLVTRNAHDAFNAVRRRCCEKTWCHADFRGLIRLTPQKPFTATFRMADKPGVDELQSLRLAVSKRRMSLAFRWVMSKSTPQPPFEILLIEEVMDSLDEAFALFTYPIKRRHWTES
jgi:hypothetical protein